jgi:probable rRNA maturation factor
MEVEVYLQEDSSPGPVTAELWNQWIGTWLARLDPCDPEDKLPLHPDRQYELSLKFTDDPGIQQLNGQFRFKDQATDVLSFASLETEVPLYPEDEAEPLYIGDIVVSLETADRQAQEQGHSLTTELAWLVSHGLLHLLGWDHPDDCQLAAMLEQQRQLLVISQIITSDWVPGPMISA